MHFIEGNVETLHLPFSGAPKTRTVLVHKSLVFISVYGPSTVWRLHKASIKSVIVLQLTEFQLQIYFIASAEIDSSSY